MCRRSLGHTERFVSGAIAPEHKPCQERGDSKRQGTKEREKARELADEHQPDRTRGDPRKQPRIMEGSKILAKECHRTTAIWTWSQTRCPAPHPSTPVSYAERAWAWLLSGANPGGWPGFPVPSSCSTLVVKIETIARSEAASSLPCREHFCFAKALGTLSPIVSSWKQAGNRLR